MFVCKIALQYCIPVRTVWKMQRTNDPRCMLYQ